MLISGKEFRDQTGMSAEELAQFAEKNPHLVKKCGAGYRVDDDALSITLAKPKSPAPVIVPDVALTYEQVDAYETRIENLEKENAMLRRQVQQIGYACEAGHAAQKEKVAAQRVAAHMIPREAICYAFSEEAQQKKSHGKKCWKMAKCFFAVAILAVL